MAKRHGAWDGRTRSLESLYVCLTESSQLRQEPGVFLKVSFQGFPFYHPGYASQVINTLQNSTKNSTFFIDPTNLLLLTEQRHH